MGEIISPRNCYVLVTLRHKGNNFATQLAFWVKPWVSYLTSRAILVCYFREICGLLDMNTRDKSTVDPGPRDTHAGPGACE